MFRDCPRVSVAGEVGRLNMETGVGKIIHRIVLEPQGR